MRYVLKLFLITMVSKTISATTTAIVHFGEIGDTSQIPGFLDSGSSTFSMSCSLESVRKVHVLAKRRSMILIMARRMKARDFRARHSKSFAKRRLRLIQARVRSTIQRLGWTVEPPPTPTQPSIRLLNGRSFPSSSAAPLDRRRPPRTALS